MLPDYLHKYYPDNRFRFNFLMNVIALKYGTEGGGWWLRRKQLLSSLFVHNKISTPYLL